MSFWPFSSSPPQARTPGPSPFPPSSQDEEFYDASPAPQPQHSVQGPGSAYSRGGRSAQEGTSFAQTHGKSNLSQDSFHSQTSAYSQRSQPSTSAGPSAGARRVGSVIIDPPDPMRSKPIRFIYKDTDGKFKVDREAMLALRCIKGPLGVAAVCGRARQGKSFILNQLLGQSSGFEVASTHRPCTKGLWIWSSPIKCTATDGSSYHLLLLDSEGIEAYDQTGTYSTQIFSLAVLLSSLFIYNQMGGIDEGAIDKLSMVTKMSSHIRVKTADAVTGGSAGTAPMQTTPMTPGSMTSRARNGIGLVSPSPSTVSGSQPEAVQDLGLFSPAFFWLLRDFYLDLSEDGKQLTPKDYLEQALQPVLGDSGPDKAKNEIRESIKSLFPDRDCFALVRPVFEEKDLRNLDQTPLNRLRPEFLRSLDLLVQAVFEKGRPKRIGDTVMTGAILAGISLAYVDAINKGAVPTILNSWKSVEEHECRRAYEQALSSYDTSMKDSADAADEAELRRKHVAAVREAEKVFATEAVGTGNMRQGWEERLQVDVEKKFEDLSGKLATASQLHCSAATERMDAQLSNLARRQPPPTVATLALAVDKMVGEYDNAAKGPAKASCLVSFLRTRAMGVLADAGEQALKTAKSASAEIESNRKLLEHKLSTAEKEADRLRAEANQLRDRGDTSARQLSDANVKLLEKEREVGQLRTGVEAAHREAERVKGEALARGRDVQALKDQLHEQKNSSRTLEDGKEKNLQRALRAEAEKDKWHAMHDEVVRKSQEELAALEKAKGDAEAAVVNLKLEHQQALSLQVGGKEAELQRLKVELDIVKGREEKLKKRLEAQLTELKGAEMAAAQMRELGSRKEEGVKKALADTQAAQREARIAKENLASLEGALQRSKERAQQAADATEAAELAARREAELKQQAIIRAEAAERELARTSGETREAQSSLQAALNRVDVAESRVRELETRIQGQQLQMEDNGAEMRGKVEALEAQLRSLQAESDRLAGEVSRKTRELQQAHAEQQEWVIERDRLNSQVSGLQAQLGRVSGELQETKTELTRVTEQVAVDSVAKVTAEREVERLMAQIRAYKGKGGAVDGAAGAGEAQERETKRRRTSEEEEDGASMDVSGAEEAEPNNNLDFEVGSPYSMSSQDPSQAQADEPKATPLRAGTAPGRGGRGRGASAKKAPAHGADAALVAQAQAMTRNQLKDALTSADLAHLFLESRNPKKDFLVELYVEHVLKKQQA